jgi:hypothetical protein
MNVIAVLMSPPSSIPLADSSQDGLGNRCSIRLSYGAVAQVAQSAQ